MGVIRDIIHVTPKVKERIKQEGKTFKEILNEELIKRGCQPTDQSKVNNHSNEFNNIISKDEDIDNDVIYNIESGQVVRDLEGTCRR